MFVFFQRPQRLWSTIKGIPVKLLELRDIQKCNWMPILLPLDLKFSPGLAPIRARSVQTNQTQASPFAKPIQNISENNSSLQSLYIITANIHRLCVIGQIFMQDHLTIDLSFRTELSRNEIRESEKPFFELTFEKTSLSNGGLVF